jgi:small conductance mechanosensitive channel
MPDVGTSEGVADKLKADAQQAAAEARHLADLVWNLVTDWGLKLIGVILLLVCAWTVAAWTRRVLYRSLNKPHFDQTLIRFLSNLSRWIILALALVAALTIFGIAPASLAAVVGATGLAVGLAMQGSLSNLAAGIMLMILRPFKVGETVNVAGQTGVVDEIELFYTKIDTADRRRVMIPNAAVFGAVIDNNSHHATRRAEVVVTIGGNVPLDQTREVLSSAIGAVEGVLSDPPPEVALLDLTPAGSVTWAVRVWVSTPRIGIVREKLVQAVKERIDEAGMRPPVPGAPPPPDAHALHVTSGGQSPAPGPAPLRAAMASADRFAR